LDGSGEDVGLNRGASVHVTAKRGSDHFRQLAARRRTHGGGGPRKESD